MHYRLELLLDTVCQLKGVRLWYHYTGVQHQCLDFLCNLGSIDLIHDIDMVSLGQLGCNRGIGPQKKQRAAGQSVQGH